MKKEELNVDVLLVLICALIECLAEQRDLPFRLVFNSAIHLISTQVSNHGRVLNKESLEDYYPDKIEGFNWSKTIYLLPELLKQTNDRREINE